MSLTEESNNLEQSIIMTPVKKEMKPIVTRSFHRNEQSTNYKRKILIKYQYNRDEHVLTYAATIFRVDLKCRDKYDLNNHKKTLEARFEKSPVVVQNFMDDKDLKDFHNKVREQLYKTGCKTAKVMVKPEVN
jgi:hypothetical protein